MNPFNGSEDPNNYSYQFAQNGNGSAAVMAQNGSAAVMAQNGSAAVMAQNGSAAVMAYDANGTPIYAPSLDVNALNGVTAVNAVVPYNGVDTNAITANAITTNGVHANGLSTNGLSTNGVHTLPGVDVNGAGLNAVSVADINHAYNQAYAAAQQLLSPAMQALSATPPTAYATNGLGLLPTHAHPAQVVQPVTVAAVPVKLPEERYYPHDGKVFVGGLSQNTTVDELKAFFTRMGEVVECFIKTDAETKRSRGFAFITFRDPAAAIRVIEGGPYPVGGKMLDCKAALPHHLTKVSFGHFLF